jgi:hypothetical protein
MQRALPKNPKHPGQKRLPAATAGLAKGISPRTANMSHGPYDAGTQFLLDTMHNPKATLRHRIECAKFLIETQPQEFNARRVIHPDDPVITIRIGGMPAEQHPPRLAAPDQDHIADNQRLS